MRRRLTPFLLLAPIAASLFLAHELAAEIVSCGPTPNHFEYEVKGGQIEITVFHPFKVFSGISHALSGTMLVNPENLSEGILIKLAAPLKGVEAPDAPASRVLAGIVEVVGDSPFEFVSQVVDLPSTVKAPPRTFRMRTVGALSFRGASYPAVVPVECTVEESYWKCQFAFQLRLSDFGLPSPQLLRVPARDTVNVRGDVTLGPKRES
jgi:hypothetical protein